MSDNQQPDMTPGRFGWNELMTSDVEAATKFYTEAFGWEVQSQEMAPGFTYHMFKQGDHMVGGMLGITAEMGPIQPHWMAYINSADVDADVAKAKAAGATILVDKKEIPNAGTLAVIQDPQGAVYSIWKSDPNAQC